MQWTEQEWFFCLSCFYRNPSRKKALAEFNLKYKRTEHAIRHRFFREGIDLTVFTGSGTGKGKLRKNHFLRELDKVYKKLGQPYTQKQYDEFANIPSYVVIGYFGDWDTALEQASLYKKFDRHTKIIDEKKNFDPEVQIKDQWKREKEDIIHRAEQKKVRQIKEQAHKLDIINEMIVSAVAKADPITVEVRTVKEFTKESRGRSCTLWFEFSDLQLGTLVTPEEMGDLNQHNWQIWQEKLAVWKRNVIDKVYTYRQIYDIERVIIACLGDMVEGQDIFKGQGWKIDTNVVDQAINGANDTAGAFSEIFMTHHDIHFDILEVFGNHGRVGAKGESPYACSMDKVYQRMLEGQLTTVREMLNYTYHRNEAWFYFVELYGWNHLILHGDQGMSNLWSSRPTVNGLEKGLSRYNQMFQQQVHFIHCGHFHNDVTWSFNMSQILINGSFVGTSPFSATTMLASSPPIQVMHVFEPRIGLAKTERIYLLDGPMKQALSPKKLSTLEKPNGHSNR